MSGAYYNENDPHAAAWLRDLITRDLIAPGEVDERDIRDVQPSELAGFDQCHWFAGIGVWSHALRRAGWTDDRPVWTGSCPCQPFSAAGKREGFADERHLWPAFFHLIEQCAPPVVLGEQVGSAGAWIDLVHADMESLGYAFGCVAIPAAGFGGAHIRDRAFWLADGDDARLEGWHGVFERTGQCAARSSSVVGRLAEPYSGGRETRLRDDPVARHGATVTANCEPSERTGAPLLGRDAPDWLLCRDAKWRPVRPGAHVLAHESAARVVRLRGYGNALDANAATAFVTAALQTTEPAWGLA